MRGTVSGFLPPLSLSLSDKIPTITEILSSLSCYPVLFSNSVSSSTSTLLAFNTMVTADHSSSYKYTHNTYIHRLGEYFPHYFPKTSTGWPKCGSTLVWRCHIILQCTLSEDRTLNKTKIEISKYYGIDAICFCFPRTESLLSPS